MKNILMPTTPEGLGNVSVWLARLILP